MLDPTRPITQAEFGVLVGVSQQAVSEFMRSAALDSTASFEQLLIAYCARLRESAAGRGSEGDGGEYIREKTRLARAQRIAQELKNATAQRQLAPINILTQVLADASQSLAAQLDALPGTLAKVAPELSEGARDAMVAAIARARNDWVANTATLEVREDPSLATDGEPEDEAEGDPAFEDD